MTGIGGFDYGRGSFDYSRRVQDRSFERLSSGKRINGAKDDAANLATVQQFLAIEAAAAQGSQNLSDGQSVARIAEGALAGTSDLLGRMQELAIQSRNGTLNDSDRAAIQQEYDELASEVTRIAESTEFNGKKLLNGDASGAGALALRDGSGGDPVKLDVEGQTADDLGITGSLQEDDILDRIGAAIDSVSTTRGRLGALDNRLGSQIRNLATTAENTAAARSRIEDADYAVETADLTRVNILGEAQMALATQGRQLQSRSVLQLLG